MTLLSNFQEEPFMNQSNMSSSIPLQIAETIQTAHINRAPDVAHDLNPSTAASSKQPVIVSHHGHSSDSSHEFDLYDDAGIDQDGDTEDIPYGVIRPLPRKPSMPPLPDLRFEQSYLASIAGADTYTRIAYITTRDQLLLPLVQGIIWNLATIGWGYWNRNAQFSGSSVGARIRRWWWRTNNWQIEDSMKNAAKHADEVGEYYVTKLGAGGD